MVIYLILVGTDYVNIKGEKKTNGSYESQQLLGRVDEEAETEFNG